MDFAEAERYVKGAVAREVEDYVGGLTGIPLGLQDKPVRFRKLPTIIYRDGTVRKVLGMYAEGDDTYCVDPVLFDKNDPEIELFGNRLPTLARVAGEELLHMAQYKTGTMRRYKRKFGKQAERLLEGAASRTADMLFGKTRVYEEEKRAYERLVDLAGEEAAFLGFPEAEPARIVKFRDYAAAA